MIELRSVEKLYGKKKNEFQALKDINFTIDDGESVAIVGKSGSGKSTLMHIMSGLDSPTSGEVIVSGKDITKMTPKQLDAFRAEEMSFIFQSFFVQGNESCYDNVSLPLEIAEVPRSQRDKAVEDAMRAVGLEDKIKQKAKDLSGGQKQRLAIARAIVGRPKILFADEPTGNLDSVTGESVEELLFSFNKELGSTLIVVTHDDELAARCDKQIRIKDGAIVEIKKGANK